MSYATLMVHLELGHPNTGLLNLVGDLAGRLRCGVVGIAVCQPLRIIYNDGQFPGDIIEHDRQDIDDEIKVAEADFHDALESRVATLEWRSAVTYRPLSEHLAKEARCADLVITGVDRNVSVFDTSHHVDIGDLVMQAGRPCLIVPKGTAKGTDRLALEHVIVGWKETSETRRAIRDTLPLLKVAGRVTVVEIADKDDLIAAHARVQDVVGWLKRHGIDATPMVDPKIGDDAVRLNAIMQEQGGDLLVAGAYGHSRLREWALGGVTRDLLLRAGYCSLVSH
jgi:nucleotide-binding universal stress UspA family protein